MTENLNPTAEQQPVSAEQFGGLLHDALAEQGFPPADQIAVDGGVVVSEFARTLSGADSQPASNIVVQHIAHDGPLVGQHSYRLFYGLSVLGGEGWSSPEPGQVPQGVESAPATAWGGYAEGASRAAPVPVHPETDFSEAAHRLEQAMQHGQPVDATRARAERLAIEARLLEDRGQLTRPAWPVRVLDKVLLPWTRRTLGEVMTEETFATIAMAKVSRSKTPPGFAVPSPDRPSKQF